MTKEIKAIRVTKVIQEPPVLLDLRVSRELKVPRVLLVQQDLRAPRAILVRLVLLALKDPKEIKATLVHRDPKEILVLQGQQGLQDRKAQPGLREIRGPKVIPAL